MTTLMQDLRYGIRMLAKNPGFTAVALITLALGIGANSAIFSVVDAVLLRPLPYRDSERLVMVWATNVRQGLTRDVTSYPDFTDWRNQSRCFERMAAFAGRYFDLTGMDEPERIVGLRVSVDLLPLLQVMPAYGRLLLPEEEEPGKNHVVLMSDLLWHRRFGGDPKLVGKMVVLNGESYTVIGIMPPGFSFPVEEHPEVFVPLTPDPSRGHGFLRVVARLKPEVGLPTAQAEMNTIARRLEQQYRADKGVGVNLVSLRESSVREVRPALLILMGVVGFVLLIACANIANLLLERTVSRQKELAVRAALGATRWRLFRHLLTESMLLATAGGVLGLTVAIWGVNALVALFRHQNLAVPRLETVRVDGWVLSFSLLISLVTGLASGIAPAIGALRIPLNESLKEGGRSVTVGLRHHRVKSLLVVFEVALSLVLLIGATLLGRSFLLLQRNNSGLNPQNILTVQFSLFEKKYSSLQRRAAFFQQVLDRIRKIPGVKTAAAVADVPMSGAVDTLSFSIQGREEPPGGMRHAIFDVISPEYFQTMGIPFRAGRDFNDEDGPGSSRVAIINEAMAHRVWPEGNPVGKRITLDRVHWFSVVGVVGDVRQLRLSAEAEPEVYLPYSQDPALWPYLSLVVRTASNPSAFVSAVKNAVWASDRDQPIANIRTMEQVLSDCVAQSRVCTALVGLFAALAFALSTVGLYGVISYATGQRVHEIGIRMALGARTRDVQQSVVRQGLALAVSGVVIGLFTAVGLTRFLSSWLYGVRPTDPLTFAAVALLLTLVALGASYLPARRAAKVDPMVALRYE